MERTFVVRVWGLMRYVVVRKAYDQKESGREAREREGLNQFQQCDGGEAQRNHCVRECVGEMYDERFHEWIRR